MLHRARITLDCTRFSCEGCWTVNQLTSCCWLPELSALTSVGKALRDRPTDSRLTPMDVVSACTALFTSWVPAVGRPSTRNSTAFVMNGLVRVVENWSYSRLMAAIRQR